MNRRILENAHLIQNGCHFHRRGGNHDIWLNPATRSESAVPRHREVKLGTAKAICKQLQIPPIASR